MKSWRTCLASARYSLPLSTENRTPSSTLARWLSASASRARLDLLLRAGLAVRAEPAEIDEAEVKASLRVEGTVAQQVAKTLAELKASRVARRNPGALVIGADQLLDCEGRWFDKPEDRERAR